jgi:O-antigen/teichoic acid export membrane protein
VSAAGIPAARAPLSLGAEPDKAERGLHALGAGELARCGRRGEDGAFRMLVEFGVLAAASLLYQGGIVFANLYAARRLGPAPYGVLAAAYLGISYSAYLTLGVTNAMGLEVPLRRGRGEDGRELTAAGWLMTLMAAAAAGMLAAGYGMWDSQARVSILCSIPLMALLLGQAFFLAHLRAQKAFFQVSWQQGIAGAAILATSIPLTRQFGIAGFMGAQSMAVLLALSVLGKRLRLPSMTRAAFHAIPGLVRLGVPIALVGAVYTLLYTADRWIVLAHFGPSGLGRYALATRISSAGLLVSGIVADQMYPRVAEMYGRTGQASSLRPLMVRQQRMMLGLMVPVAAAVFVAAPDLMTRFFPTYAASAPLLRILLVAYMFLSFSQPLGVVLNVLRRQRVYLTIQGLSLAGLAGACHAAVRLGGGLNAVAGTVCGVFAVYLFLLWIVTERALGDQ